MDCEGEEVEQSDLHSFSFDEYVMDVSFQDACQKIDPHLEMFLAITLALFDYLRKSSVSGGYVVSSDSSKASMETVDCEGEEVEQSDLHSFSFDELNRKILLLPIHHLEISDDLLEYF